MRYSQSEGDTLTTEEAELRLYASEWIRGLIVRKYQTLSCNY